MRNAYYRAVADIVMEVTRRASDIVTSPSSSDRAAFPPVPALDSAQFSTLVNSHRRVARDSNPLMRSATTPPVASAANKAPLDVQGRGRYSFRWCRRACLACFWLVLACFWPIFAHWGVGGSFEDVRHWPLFAALKMQQQARPGGRSGGRDSGGLD